MNEIYINFRTKIDKGSAGQLIAVIGKAIEKKSKINLIISSPGGEVQSSIELYDYIKGLPDDIEVNTYAIGQVYSGAVLLYCTGKERFAHSRSEFLIHGVRIDAAKKTIKQLEEEIIPDVKKRSGEIAKIIIKETGRKEEDVREDLKGEKKMNAKEAKEYGLINKDIEDKIIKTPGAPVITILSQPTKKQ